VEEEEPRPSRFGNGEVLQLNEDSASSATGGGFAVVERPETTRNRSESKSDE
jgi:hypothetical protein